MSSTDIYLDDLTIGQTWVGGPIPMSEEGIVRFATEFDPQPMHADVDAAETGRFGGIIASGWHVASLVMRDFVDRAPLGNTPLLGLKVDDLNWKQVVRPGDILSVQREVTQISRSRSKPDRGIVTMQMTVTNQLGQEVMSFTNLIQVPVRGSS